MGTMNYILYIDFNIASCNLDLYNTPRKRKDMGSRLIGYGAYLPEKIMTNQDFEKIMDTTDEWISQRTGICATRIKKR